MFCRKCGKENQTDAKICVSCESPMSKQPSVAPTAQPITASSINKMSTPPLEIPDGVKGWSWGAFLLNWIWAIGNRTWWGLLALIPYVNIIVAIWLGIKGREMAWANKQWDSLEHFNRTQKKWSQWGIGLCLSAFVVGILAAIAIPAYKTYQEKLAESQISSLSNVNDLQPEVLPTETINNPVIEQASVDQGDINSPNLPLSLNTIAGVLTRTQTPSGNQTLTINGVPIFQGDDAQYQFPVKQFKLSGEKEAILIASSGGRGNSCETLFFFLLIDKSGMQNTPLFGTCSPEGTFSQVGDEITLKLLKMGGNSVSVLKGGILTKDGLIVMKDAGNNPSD